ncbi:hypothetical protein [Bacillus sp. FJAT-45350]|uniref:hypothetical protein n=1 Tax=Bacillus sp. FJAT-45350 TaxID=2011014 RepID=UPI0015CDED03|nr:hypothetical protein [Bacillus sp. FJAT-45350]
MFKKIVLLKNINKDSDEQPTFNENKSMKQIVAELQQQGINAELCKRVSFNRDDLRLNL